MQKFFTKCVCSKRSFLKIAKLSAD